MVYCWLFSSVACRGCCHVVKVTEISQVVMETVHHHLDDGCQDDSDHRAGHVISMSPQVDFIGLPEVFSRPEL